VDVLITRSHSTIDGLFSMRNRTVITTIASLIVMAFSSLSHAQISVSRSVLEFSNSKKVQDIEVFNSGTHNVYLDLKAAEIINPESENATRVELNDPRTSPLIVSPRQLLVPPGERRRMRVVMRQPSLDQERVFRLSVKPYAGSLKIDDAGDDTKSSAIKVLVGYDLLLLSRPENINPSLEVRRNNDEITFRNKGNTNVLLRKIEQCDADGRECVEIQPNRLYVGEVYKVNLPKKGNANKYPVKVWQSVGLDNSQRIY